MTVTKEFTANNTNGSVDVEFTFDASLLAGEDVVAFESLVKDGVEVAVHADIEDEGQTVVVDNPETPGAPYDKTGNDLLPVWVLISALVVCGGAAGAYALRSRIRQSASADEGPSGEDSEE